MQSIKNIINFTYLRYIWYKDYIIFVRYLINIYNIVNKMCKYRTI